MKRKVQPETIFKIALILAAAASFVFSISLYFSAEETDIAGRLNGIYVGTDAKQWVNFEMDGKRISKRAVSGRFGHTRWPEVAEIAASAGHVLKRVPWKPKLTYIIPIAADRRDRRAITRTLASVALPYVKRGETVAPTKYRNHRPKA